MIIQQTFKNAWPTIYLVGTPIGNLEDFSFRGQQTLSKVDLILCEDTRTSLALLKKYDINQSLLSFHKFNEHQRLEEIQTLLNASKNLAIISDAGMPTISDPGASLIYALHWELNSLVNVSAVNAGPAYIHALAISGFKNQHNYFYGFIKNKTDFSKENELKNVFESLDDVTVIFYESVHRIKATMATLTKILDPHLKMTLNRELTKINEEVVFGTINEVNDFVQSEAFIEKGEFVLVIDYHRPKIVWGRESLKNLLDQEISQGLSLKEATKKVSLQTQVAKNELYELYLKQK